MTEMLSAEASTHRLCELYKQQQQPQSSSEWNVETIKACVASGANVMAIINDKKGHGAALLSQMMLHGALEASLVCLQTPHPLDFTLTDIEGHTPLHIIAAANTGDDHYNVELLRAVVDRLSRHPEDTVDWSQENDDDLDFLSLAAENQLLSAFWPVVKEVPYFADKTAPLKLQGLVWEWDWKDFLHLAETTPPSSLSLPALTYSESLFISSASQITGKLWKITQQSRAQLLESGTLLKIQQYVAEHAQVTFLCDPEFQFGHSPILYHFIEEGLLDAFRACLRSPQKIDFTVVHYFGHTPLHAIALANTGDDDYNVELLRAVVDRTSRHPEDKIDWGKRDNDGKDFLSLAADNQLLSTLWPVVKEVPYFVHHTALDGKILLSSRPWSWDWDQLGVLGEQSHFDSMEPVRESFVVPCNRATGRLWKLLERPGAKSVEEFAACAKEGANFMHCDTTLDAKPAVNTPLLTHFFYSLEPEKVKALLDNSVFPIDFTVVDPSNGSTALHLIPSARRRGPDGVKPLLTCIIDRLEAHPEDRVNWGQKNLKGQDPISVAAAYGQLSAWVQLVLHDRPVPYYVEFQGEMPITHHVSPEDWNRVPSEDQKRFHLFAGFDAA